MQLFEMVNANDATRLPNNEESSVSSSSPPLTPAHFWASTLALCFCTLAHAYLLISVFPYSGYLAIYLLPNTANEENAGAYAGWIASSFMLGRAISSYSWGKWADIYGRRTILCASLALSGLFSILFGMSQTFGSALVCRGFLGVSNGIIGTTKTLMSELAENNEALETRGMALVVGMRGFGFLVCPAIGGSLAEVVKQYPTAAWVIRFEPFLSRFPFLLPNIVGAIFCIASFIMVKLCVKETLPADRLHPPTEIVGECLGLCRRMLCIPRIRQQEEHELIKETSLIPNYTLNSLKEDDEEENSNERSHSRHAQQHRKHNNGNADQPVTMATIWSRPDTRRHLIIYWVYSFVIISVDEAFPLFCISKQAGLSLSEAAIGKILSISGLIFVTMSIYLLYSIGGLAWNLRKHYCECHVDNSVHFSHSSFPTLSIEQQQHTIITFSIIILEYTNGNLSNLCQHFLFFHYHCHQSNRASIVEGSNQWLGFTWCQYCQRNRSRHVWSLCSL